MKIPKIEPITLLENILILLHGFILMLVLGYDQLQFPLFLEVFGRTHPLFLHFPLVILLGLGFILLLPKYKYAHHLKLIHTFFLIGLLFCGLTVLAGIFLSKENGYSGQTLELHFWSGNLTFWLGSIGYYLSKTEYPYLLKLTTSALLLVLIITGHLGATLTHGEKFVIAPLANSETKNQEEIPWEEAEVYLHLIQPILQTKCISCHQESKQKGELRLDKISYILKGGKNGHLFDQENPENSLLLQRIHLPLEDENHMPPKGKVQLTEEEIELLHHWISDSVNFSKKIMEYPENSQLLTLAKKSFANHSKKAHPFKEASLKTIQSLNNFYRKVTPIEPNSPALEVKFYGQGQFDVQQLKELKSIQEQVVSIQLNQMPLSSDELNELKGFIHLERLYLNFTGIQEIKPLMSLKNLKILSLSGNPLAKTEWKNLKSLKELELLFAWNCGLTKKDLEEIQKDLPKLKIETGFDDSAVTLPLNPPKIEFEKALFKENAIIHLSHPIKSAQIFYTLDGSLPKDDNKIPYTEPIQLTSSATLKAIATSKGWEDSKENQAVFIQSGIKPDNFQLKFSPHDKYKGKGVSTLFDHEKGDLNFGSGKWLGFTDTNLEVEMEFNSPQSIKKVGFSLLSDEVSYIFPPQKLEIWVKSENSNWILLDSASPQQPQKTEEKKSFFVELKANHQNVKRLKAIAKPLLRLPNWHPGSGQKSWVFIDEITIN
jgi:hypothetical protein